VVPDEISRPALLDDGEPVRVDLLDDLLIFVERKAALVGPDGYPISWLHYRAGMESIARERARERLDVFAAVVTAMAKPEDRTPWLSMQRIAAGLPANAG
jgi:hypothetical protein